MIGHAKQITRPDGPDTDAVHPSDWMAAHVVTGLLGLFDSLASQPGKLLHVDESGVGRLIDVSMPAKNVLAAATVALMRAALGAAANDSPNLTGAPSAPTPALGTNTDQIATMAALKAMRDDLVGAAPGLLDTFAEIAAALGSDPNFAASVLASLGNRLRFDAAQSLTTGQKAQAVSNLGIGNASVRNVGTGSGDVAAGDLPFTFPAPNAILRPGAGKWADRADVRDWGVVFNGTDESAKLQRAFDQCPVYETLWGASGTISVGANGDQCVQLTRPVPLRGLRIAPLGSVGGSVDCLNISPTLGYDWGEFTLSNCVIGDRVAGRFGRYGIHVTTSALTDALQSAVFENLFVLNGGAGVADAFRHTDTGNSQGGMAGSVLRNSRLLGGLTLIGTGDRISIEDSQFLPNNTGGAMITVSTAAGAMNFQFLRNNCGATSLRFRNGLHPQAIGNTFEQTIAAYQPNSAVLDFDGDLGVIDGAIVENNVFQMLEAVSPSYLVRLNNVSRPRVKSGNRFSSAIARTPIVVTAQATGTFISRDNTNLTGAALVNAPAYVDRHEKAVRHRFMGDGNLSFDPREGDHTVTLHVTLTADRTLQLPMLSECLPGEEFVFQDDAIALGGTYKVVLATQGGAVFHNTGTTSINLTTGGMRVTVKAIVADGVWYVIKSSP